MNFRTFRYFWQEGVKSFFKNGVMTVASIITVALCLVLLGIYLLFSANLNYAAQKIEETYEIQVFIEDQADDARIEQMKGQIAAMENIRGVTFFSREEAFAQWKERFGDDTAVLDGFDLDNPLRHSFKITFVDLKSADPVIDKIGGIEGIAKIKNDKGTIDRLIHITEVVKNVSFWFMLVFALISVFIISNAIRLTVFARRREVNIMKFVGATDAFIGFPFMVEGILIGIAGAGSAVLLVSRAYGHLLVTAAEAAKTAEFLSGDLWLYTTSQVLGMLCAFLFGMGIALGAVGSVVSLRRHLHV